MRNLEAARTPGMVEALAEWIVRYYCLAKHLRFHQFPHSEDMFCGAFVAKSTPYDGFVSFVPRCQCLQCPLCSSLSSQERDSLQRRILTHVEPKPTNSNQLQLQEWCRDPWTTTLRQWAPSARQVCHHRHQKVGATGHWSSLPSCGFVRCWERLSRGTMPRFWCLELLAADFWQEIRELVSIGWWASHCFGEFQQPGLPTTTVTYKYLSSWCDRTPVRALWQLYEICLPVSPESLRCCAGLQPFQDTATLCSLEGGPNKAQLLDAFTTSDTSVRHNKPALSHSVAQVGQFTILCIFIYSVNKIVPICGVIVQITLCVGPGGAVWNSDTRCPQQSSIGFPRKSLGQRSIFRYKLLHHDTIHYLWCDHFDVPRNAAQSQHHSGRLASLKGLWQRALALRRPVFGIKELA